MLEQELKVSKEKATKILTDILVDNHEKGLDTVCILGTQFLSPEMRAMLGLKN